MRVIVLQKIKLYSGLRVVFYSFLTELSQFTLIRVSCASDVSSFRTGTSDFQESGR